jgi:predicted amidophosphoribosyltransferase
LVRRVAVTKSATAGGARPDARAHFESLDVAGLALSAPRRILIVDDVVTSGATLLACASRVQDAHPGAQVLAFGLIRAMSRVEVDEIPAPCVGTITLDPYSGLTTRRP